MGSLRLIQKGNYLRSLLILSTSTLWLFQRVRQVLSYFCMMISWVLVG